MKEHRRVTEEEVMLAIGALDSMTDEDLMYEIKELDDNLEFLQTAKITSLRTHNTVYQTRKLLGLVLQYRRTGSLELP